MALASLSEYEAITGELADPARVLTLLDLASSAVLAGAYGQLITQGTTTDLRVEPHDGHLYLPQRPVVSVAEVKDVGGVIIDPDEYKTQPGGNGLPAVISRVGGWSGPHVVTYTHGWDPIPGQIVALVCSLAKATVDNDGGPASSQETTGPFSESWSEPQQAGMALTASARRTIDKLCRIRSATSVPMVRDR